MDNGDLMVDIEAELNGDFLNDDYLRVESEPSFIAPTNKKIDEQVTKLADQIAEQAAKVNQTEDELVDMMDDKFDNDDLLSLEELSHVGGDDNLLLDQTES